MKTGQRSILILKKVWWARTTQAWNINSLTEIKVNKNSITSYTS